MRWREGGKASTLESRPLIMLTVTSTEGESSSGLCDLTKLIFSEKKKLNNHVHQSLPRRVIRAVKELKR